MEFPGLLKKLQGEFPGVNYKQSTISRGDQENGISRSRTSMREYGTKTTPVFLPADGAQWNQRKPNPTSSRWQVRSEKAKKG